LLALIILLGAYLRLTDLGGPSLWLDEILHLQVTQSLSHQPWYRLVAGVREIAGKTENGALYFGLRILGQRLAPVETDSSYVRISGTNVTISISTRSGRKSAIGFACRRGSSQCISSWRRSWGSSRSRRGDSRRTAVVREERANQILGLQVPNR
jgi:hypothetical protein